MAAETSGLKWAPIIGPKTLMSTYRPQTVARVLASRAMAMMPDPITIASSSTVPNHSAKRPLAMVTLSVGVNVFERALQLGIVHGFRRQLEQLKNPVGDRLTGKLESAAFALPTAGVGRIWIDPVCFHRTSGPDWTGFGRSAVAKCGCRESAPQLSWKGAPQQQVFRSLGLQQEVAAARIANLGARHALPSPTLFSLKTGISPRV